MPVINSTDNTVTVSLEVPLANPPSVEDSKALEAYLKRKYPSIRRVEISLRNPVPFGILTTADYAKYMHEAWLVLSYVGKELIKPVVVKLAVDFLLKRGKRVVAGKVTHGYLEDEVSSERSTMRRIREAIAGGQLKDVFRASDVNNLLGITFAGTFLPKHRVGNPGKNTEHFVRVERGLYRLKNPR